MTFNYTILLGASGLFLLFLFLVFLIQRKNKAIAPISFSGTKQIKAAGFSWKIKLRWIPLFLRIAAIFILLIAFSRPQKGLEVIKTAREGVAIQMVIDRSSSMTEPLTFRGVESDRLSVVKKVFAEFINGNDSGLQGRSNDMIGLNSFAGFVEENSPLTLDHNTLVNFAKTIRPASRVEDGTMIGDALYYSVLRLISVDELLKKAGEKNNDYKIKSKIIILLTDGQQTRGGMSPLEAAQFAADNDIKVYTIAIVNDQNYKRQDSLFGQFFSLMDRPLDTSMLDNVAGTTGGLFAKADSGESLVKIYEQIDEMEKSQFDERFTTFKEIFPIFVIIGLGLLLLELLLSNTLFRTIP